MQENDLAQNPLQNVAVEDFEGRHQADDKVQHNADHQAHEGGSSERNIDPRQSNPSSFESLSSDDDEPEAHGTTNLDDEDDLSDVEDAPPDPYYTYKTEKADAHADSKLIYQRLRLDTKTGSDASGSPYLLGKSWSMPPEVHFEGIGLGRSPSISSRKSRQSHKAVPALNLSHHAHEKTEPFPSLQEHAVAYKEHMQDLATANGARDGKTSESSRRFTESLLSGQSVHGAGAGVGLGDGPGGFARNDGVIVTEVEAICDKIKRILDFRQKYMKVSLQCPGDNPKDDPSWNVYPAPPDPVWNEEKARPPVYKEDGTIQSASSSMYISDHRSMLKDGFKWGSTNSMPALEAQTPTSPSFAKKRRKMGTFIGEDFDFDECHIPGKPSDSFSFKLDEASVFQVYDTKGDPIITVPTLRDYYKTLDEILDIASDGPAKSFAYRRLQYLEGRYGLYTLLNEYQEVADTKKVPHRDFYNVRKVDTHVHHSACMNQKHLLRFIKSKMKKCPDEVVIDRDGKKLTLSEVFESINLTAYDLSIDTLDMHAHTDSFHRFDKFNLKYNPIGQSRLRDIFLKTDNFVKGKYLAEITREVISDLESSKYQMVEWRISIYGRNIKEWDTLAAWVVDNKLFSPNVRWLIQIPRLYALYKSINNMQNFEEILRNVFQPLFEVTEDPSSHPKLHVFLQRVIGFDSVDDESKPERRIYRKFPTPKDWATKQNPPYNYWIYHLFANMTSLNHWRQRRGFNTFLLRPHCGEAGDTDHLAAAILCCHSISHGLTLRKVPLLQYIFYLDQIGIAMSPLSNNALFLTYDRNPFISYFKKGLNVSLSTDDPLQFAFTKEPLIEEYSVAAQIYKLSAIDMCELAKHSVDQCGFELQLKQRWLGRHCYLPGVLGNDVSKGNVPDIREAFRHETLRGEHSFIARYTKDYTHQERCTPTMPDPHDTTSPNEEVYKTLESPRLWHNKIAETMQPSELVTSPDGEIRAHDFAALTKKSSAGRDRVSSHASMPSKAPYLSHSLADAHVSGSEPKAFPGIVSQDQRRRSSVRNSRSGSVASDKMSTSPQLEISLAKYRSRQSDTRREAEDSD